VEYAAASTGFPFVGQYDGAKVETPAFLNSQGSGIIVDFNAVSSGYLEAMGVRLIRGRLLAESDSAGTPNVAVIDENLAQILWPDQDPLGKLINTNDPAKPVWRRVVGVIAPLRNRSLDSSISPNVIVPLSQAGGYVNFIVLKSSAEPKEAARMIRNAVANVDSNQGVFFAQSFPELIQNTIEVRHFLFIALAFFGAAALALSALGIYSLVSFIAASRVREVGIRIALGATRQAIAALVISNGIRLALTGAAVGIFAVLLLGRLLSTLLFGVRSFDIETLLITVVILESATLVAALIPAWRSARIQPMEALRSE
jgi:ABC-type antimicrobial peptide transport system permease subunit